MLVRSVVLLLAVLSCCGGSDFFFSGSPFGGGMGGMGGAGRGRTRDVSYYDALGLDPSASDQQVKRSYRKKAMETHPDKGGDPEAFKKITEAYEVLSDPSKKSMYDKYGKEGLNNSDGGGGAGNSGSAADLAREIFRGFGGGGFGGGGFGGSAFGGAFGPPPIYLQIELTLEDLFRGKEIPVQLGRSGENGDNHVLKVKIDRGMMDGQELIARQQPIDPSGNLRDLVFRIKERRHTLFRRRNADLLLDIKISLREALVGFDYCIPHLDGTDLWIRRRPGEITSFGQVLILANQGMPLADRPSKRGKLFVRVEVGKLVPHSSTLVELPNKMSVSEESLRQLEQLLPDSGFDSIKQKKRNKRQPSSADEIFIPSAGSLDNFGSSGAQEEERHDSSFGQFFFR